MISTDSLKPFIWAIQFASFLRAIPYTWDTKLKRAHAYVNGSSRRETINYWISKCFIVVALMGFIGIILFLAGIMIMEPDIQADEVICGILCVGTFIVPINCHLVNEFLNERFMVHLNSLMILNEVFGKLNQASQFGRNYRNY